MVNKGRLLKNICDALSPTQLRKTFLRAYDTQFICV